MKENIVQKKSFLFAERIVNLYRFLIDTQKEFVLAKQILRSSTSIGANIEETLGSGKEFLQKVSISYREARETHYWLRLLRSWGYISEEQFYLSPEIPEIAMNSSEYSEVSRKQQEKIPSVFVIRN